MEFYFNPEIGKGDKGVQKQVNKKTFHRFDLFIFFPLCRYHLNKKNCLNAIYG